MSLFDPSVEQCRASVAAANERSTRLSGRIHDAIKALRNGAPAASVIAILDGHGSDFESVSGSRSVPRTATK